MPVYIKPTSVIKARLGLGPNRKMDVFFANECAKAMDKFVPMRDGWLRDYKIVGNLIIYGDGPANAYAAYQYYGMRKDGTHIVNPEHYTTPGTGPYWDKRMWSAKGSEILEIVQAKFGGK